MKTCTKDKDFIRKVKENIINNSLLEKGDTVICGLSGGADSVCLLVILNKLKDELGIDLKAAHLNHGIRGEEADRDEAFSKSLCRELGVEIFTEHKDIPGISGGKNTELVAREERYKFFGDLSDKFSGGKIAVAHNKNDVAETMVMRLIRGSSVFGLKGIPVKNNKIIRPLLSVTREEIEAFLESENISFVTDSSNLTDDYTRNKIRHKILPEMKNINEGYLTAIGNTAAKLSEVSDFIKEEAYKSYGEISGVIDTDKLNGLHKVIKEYILAESAYSAGIEELSKQNISDILDLAENSSGKKVNLPGEHDAVKVYSLIKFVKKIKSESYYKELKIGENYIEEAGYTILIEKSKKGIDLEKIKMPLVARPRVSGDYIEIKGTNGRKKIKSLYVDEKLPLDKRAVYPVIVSGNKIVFALGRCGKEFISDENTKEAYTITIREGV